MSEQLTVWSEGMRDGIPAGVLHWGEGGELTLFGKTEGLYVTDLDMASALSAGQKAGYGTYPCAGSVACAPPSVLFSAIQRVSRTPISRSGTRNPQTAA